MVARAVVAALVVLAVLPAAASAHAQLQSTTPERGQRLDAAPKEIVLDFNEPVEVAFGAVKVFDAKGTPVQSGGPFHRGGHNDQVAVKLPAGIPQGGYTVTFRVISADSHPVSGGFVFTYGRGAGPGATVDELLAGSGAGKVTSTALSAVRAIQYGAIALAGGALIFFLLCWRPGLADASGKPAAWPAAEEAFRARVRLLLIWAAGAGGVSAVLALVLQGANAGGTTFWSALDPNVLRDVVGTRFGTVWGLGLLAWTAMLAIVVLSKRRLPVLPAGVLAAALCLVPALGGHAAVQSPRALLLPANVLHVAAMAAWLGGVAMLVLALRSATRAVEAGDRMRLLTSVVARFSAMAGIAIAVILLTGVAQAIVYVESPKHLLDTAFGRAVLIKSVLFVLICALGFVNRNRILPRLRAAQESAAAAGALLRRTLRFELVLGVAVIAVTGALAGYPPSTAQSSGPYSGSAVIGPARVEVTVDPATTGANEMHLYLFDRRSGAQWDRADEVTVHARLPGKGIEPIAMATEKAGPGHYVISGATFGVAGDWKVDIAARVGEFDLYTATLGVPIE